MILTMIMIQIIAKVSVFLAQATKKMKIIMQKMMIMILKKMMMKKMRFTLVQAEIKVKREVREKIKIKDYLRK